ncbi:MAG: MarP family serine protease [Candidatus Dormibacteraeota bacterium]|nr:MarP family serine protease [Candidatus Dormibacteraeota bacterium]
MAATLVGVANGYRRGFWLSATQYLGLLAGVLLGAVAAQPVLDYIRVNSPVARPLGAMLVLIIGGSLGSSIGYATGEPIRRRILRIGIHSSTDSLGGAALSAVAVLAMMWFLGLSFSRGPSQEVAQLIQKSVVLHELDSIAPRPPAFLARVGGILAGVNFPSVFAGLDPALPAPLPVPPSVATPQVLNAAKSVVKVTSVGCGGLVTGSGFAVGGGYIVTNAHVVSGTRGHHVQTPSGDDLAATVVYFDPNRDFALLTVPGLQAAPLGFGPASRGTEGAVIGYPGGGRETIEPAVVDGAVEAQGRDIYSTNPVTRQVFVIQSKVRPGNSGGPLLDLQGNVLGIVFAASASDPNQGYALTDDEIASDLQDARGRHPVDTSQYACAA